MHLSLTIHFTPDEWQHFMRPITGAGGGQIFIRRCQEHVDYRNRSLSLTGEDVDRWFRYRDQYGHGGFQSRLGHKAA